MKNEVTTTEIMEFLQEHMATKEDLNRFLTKEDSKDFARKEDLKTFLTKEDSKNFATKEDIKDLRMKADSLESQIDMIAAQVVHIDARLDSFATKDDLHVLRDEMITTVDSFMKLHEHVDHEQVAMQSKYDRLEERLKVVEEN